MNLLTLSWAYFRAKPLNSFLNVLLISLGIGLTSILLLLNNQLKARLYKNIENIHLVVGAKGSPLQMILAYVYHIDMPTGNIPLSESFLLTKNPYVERAIPLALGDSYKEFRIVGTDSNYLGLYDAKIAQGKLFSRDLEATIGYAVAKKLKLKLGSSFFGAHGLVADENMHSHEDYPYQVVGILEKTNTVLDQLILVNVSSVWRVHENHAHDESHDLEILGDSSGMSQTHAHGGHSHSTCTDPTHNHGQKINLDSLAPISPEGKEITAYLVQYKRDGQGEVSAMATNMVPKMINDNSEKMGYAMPPLQLQRLLDMTGVGTQFLTLLAGLIMFVSALSTFISLYNSLKERRYEIALMRVMGASRFRVFALVVMEGVLSAFLGLIIGLAISHLGMAFLAEQLEESYKYEFSGAIFLISELWLALLALGLGFLAALLPAFGAYRVDISATLSR